MQNGGKKNKENTEKKMMKKNGMKRRTCKGTEDVDITVKTKMATKTRSFKDTDAKQNCKDEGKEMIRKRKRYKDDR